MDRSEPQNDFKIVVELEMKRFNYKVDSQTCVNNHLWTTASCLQRPA
jgi:hypothetical protein